MKSPKVKPPSHRSKYDPTRRRALPAAQTSQVEIDGRRRLIAHLIGIVEDKKSPMKRRDEMAICLAKVLATAQPRAPQPPKSKAGPKPRASTYVSKKRQADTEAMTAHKGSAWNGLVNGNAHPIGDDDDQGDDE